MTQALATAREQSGNLKSEPHSLSRRAYRSDFERLASTALQSEPQWLARFRREAIEKFESLGFPTMKNEDWHFTSVGPIAERVFHPAELTPVSGDFASNVGLPDLGGPMFVFVNGHYSAELSSEAASTG
ncbi:MAG TPA: hypothetical protein VJB15_06425, partial [Rhodothermia bacterium]|nr:hypothetical protein [Rhodothermia bacterium]